MRPFLLERASQFRAGPPPSLDEQPVREGPERDRGLRRLNSTVRTQEQTAIAYFWNGNNINQYNVTMQNVVAQHDMDIVDAAHLFAMGEIVTTDAGIACYDSKFFYRLAADHGDPERRQGRQPRHDRRPDLAAAAGGAGPPRVPVAARLLHGRLHDALAAALRTQHLDVTMPGGQNGSPVLTTTQHFNTVNDIQEQVVDARVWIGFHYRNSVKQGEKLGNRVADWELDRFFQPSDS